MKLRLSGLLQPRALSQVSPRGGGPCPRGGGPRPLVTAVLTLTLCAGSLFMGRQRGAATPPPLSGVLYSAAADTAPATVGGALSSFPAAAAYPEVKLSVASAARGKFPPGTDFHARIVPTEGSTFAITIANPPGLATARPRQEKKVEAPSPAPAVEPPAPPPPSPQAAPEPVVTALAAQPVTFVEYDEALQASPTTEAINLRLKRSGVTFRATHVGRVGERAVVRFAIANEESSDFFLSIVNVRVNDKPVHSETAGPYACRFGQEIFGIVHLKAAEVAGKRVTVELVESGGERRRFLLTLAYRF